MHYKATMHNKARRLRDGHVIALFYISKATRPGSEVLSLELFHMDDLSTSFLPHKDTSNSSKPKSLLLPVTQNGRS